MLRLHGWWRLGLLCWHLRLLGLLVLCNSGNILPFVVLLLVSVAAACSGRPALPFRPDSGIGFRRPRAAQEAGRDAPGGMRAAADPGAHEAAPLVVAVAQAMHLFVRVRVVKWQPRLRVAVASQMVGDDAMRCLCRSFWFSPSAESTSMLGLG